MRTHSSSKRTPRASTWSWSRTVIAKGWVWVDIESSGTREHQTTRLTQQQLRHVGVAVVPGPARHSMSSSSRLQQITNHLSNNYSRGLLNGDVAIITGTYSLWPGAPS
jgi:hypothetical protein